MADGPVILTWNTTNWATVTIMAALSFAGLGLLTKLIKKSRAGKAAQAAS